MHIQGASERREGRSHSAAIGQSPSHRSCFPPSCGQIRCCMYFCTFMFIPSHFYNTGYSLTSLVLWIAFLAKDEDAFFADYAQAHLKLSELGWVPEISYRNLIMFLASFSVSLSILRMYWSPISIFSGLLRLKDRGILRANAMQIPRWYFASRITPYVIRVLAMDHLLLVLSFFVTANASTFVFSFWMMDCNATAMFGPFCSWSLMSRNWLWFAIMSSCK